METDGKLSGNAGVPEGGDPIESYYDSKHGSPNGGKDHEPVSDAEAWGTRQVPVQDEGLPAKNLRSA